MSRLIDKNIFVSNALIASLWHHVVILFLKIDKPLDCLMSMCNTFHNFATNLSAQGQHKKKHIPVSRVRHEVEVIEIS